MTIRISPSRQSGSATAGPWRGLIAAVVVVAVGWAGVVCAANNSVQGAKKDEGGFDGDAPTAILIEASSGSVLFEKNADELRAPSSMMKLMTAEVVFHAVQQGDVKLTDEYRVSEYAWRKGGAPAGGSTMFAAIHSKISVDDPLLTSLDGADGLKTGYTKEGGYGMVGSAVQNGIRLIVVINGLDDPDDRASEAKKMLEWGFRNFEARTLFAAEQPVGYAKVFGGESRSVKLASREPVKVMVQKNGTDKLIARVIYNGPVRAPIESGQQVGVVKVWRGANIAVETPVYTAESVSKGSTMRRAIDGVSELVIGMFRAGAEKL